jgi:hypothetical protein
MSFYPNGTTLLHPSLLQFRKLFNPRSLVEAATAILKTHEVEDFLTFTFERQEKREPNISDAGVVTQIAPNESSSPFATRSQQLFDKKKPLPHTRKHWVGGPMPATPQQNNSAWSKPS